MKVNGDILTKTELEAKQIAALRGRINSAVDAEAMKNDDTLKKMIAEVTPEDPRRHHRRDAAASSSARRRATTSPISSSRTGVAEHPQGPEPRRRGEVQGGARAGRHDDGRPAAATSSSRSRSIACSRTKSGRSCRSPRKRRGSTTSAHQSEFVEPPTVTLREISIEIPTSTQGGAGRHQRRAGRCGEAKADAIRARVMAGEDFAKVAAEVSTSPSKANGGLIGPLPLEGAVAGDERPARRR